MSSPGTPQQRETIKSLSRTYIPQYNERGELVAIHAVVPNTVLPALGLVRYANHALVHPDGSFSVLGLDGVPHESFSCQIMAQENFSYVCLRTGLHRLDRLGRLPANGIQFVRLVGRFFVAPLTVEDVTQMRVNKWRWERSHRLATFVVSALVALLYIFFDPDRAMWFGAFTAASVGMYVFLWGRDRIFSRRRLINIVQGQLLGLLGYGTVTALFAIMSYLSTPMMWILAVSLSLTLAITFVLSRNDVPVVYRM